MKDIVDADSTIISVVPVYNDDFYHTYITDGINVFHSVSDRNIYFCSDPFVSNRTLKYRVYYSVK